MFESEELKAILDAELSFGNEIAEQSAWPPKCQSLVILKKRFHQPYERAALNYRLIDDRHYWYAEYATETYKEVLACGF